MNNGRLFLCLIAVLASGCATSLAPSENFNDWTNSAISRYPEPRSPNTATQTAAREPASKRAPLALTQATGQRVHP